MTPTTRPTIDAALTQAGKLKTLRENIKDNTPLLRSLRAFRKQQQANHAEVMAAFQETADIFKNSNEQRAADAVAKRDIAIVEAVNYCVKKLGRRFRDVDDLRGVVGLAVTIVYPQWSGASSFNSYAYKAAKRALEGELGMGVVSPSREERRKNVRATLVDINKIA